MERLVCGILAHVDAGKTTLSEAMLYAGGKLRKLGRVDHKDAFLDTDTIERERGITIFSKQAVLPLEHIELMLLDTPGHVDFSAEMERTLAVLDYAILVISGTDGVQGHTRTLWRLLDRYHIPVFIFVNKMDLNGADKAQVLSQLRAKLDSRCTDMTELSDETYESIATSTEAALEEYLETGAVSHGTIKDLISNRDVFPCYFGSALKLSGVEEFMSAMDKLMKAGEYDDKFGARVYKISRDDQGARLTHMKITGGSLRVKDQITGGSGDDSWTEKADQIRIYSGEKFTPVDEAPAGTVCAVAGLSRTVAGEGLGSQRGQIAPMLEPVLSYQAILPEGTDPNTALLKFRQLEEEDPQLRVVWSEQLRQISVQLMGQVQVEVMERLLLERFGMAVTFGQGGIVYRETISNTVEGVGHYEPLRHYAEVHLLLEPGEPGSGVTIGTSLSEDVLDRNWQRLILTHLYEKTHLGVLTGSPLTDVRITLAAGRAHLKHTEGGDFRQATYRAVRQGLMQAKSVLLEPWYDFILEVPDASVGRAISDLQRMNAKMEQPMPTNDGSVITGRVPVSQAGDYARTVTAYTRGEGRFFCSPGGYEPCSRQEQVVEELGYDPERDVENTPDSVFCAHGAGFVVKWNEVPEYMHLDSVLASSRRLVPGEAKTAGGSLGYAGTAAQDKELQAIFEKTYGEVKRKEFVPRTNSPKRYDLGYEKREIVSRFSGQEYLLIDGYNIIFAWDDLKKVAQDNLDAARKMLMDVLSNFRGFRNVEVILVFDAYKVKGGVGHVEKYHNIHIVYTKEAETADTYIEKAACELTRKHKVWVATSDGPEQLIILGSGALRLTVADLRSEVEAARVQIADIIKKAGYPVGEKPMAQAIEKARQQAELRDKGGKK